MTLVRGVALAIAIAAAFAAPAGAATCAGTPVFAEDSVRVMADAKGTVACAVGRRHAHDLGEGEATPLEAEGFFLTYRAVLERGNSETRLLDVRSGKRRIVSSASFRAFTSVVGLLADGTVAFIDSNSSGAALAFRYHVLPLDGTRKTVTEGAQCSGCEPRTVAGSEAFAPDGSGYARYEDGRIDSIAGAGTAAVASEPKPVPFVKRKKKCRHNIVLRRGAIRVVRTAPKRFAICGGGRPSPIGNAFGFTSAGNEIVYRLGDALLQNDVVSSYRAGLASGGDPLVTGLSEKGSVTWIQYGTDLWFSDRGGDPRRLAHCPAGADPATCPVPASFALAPDGTAYWRLGSGEVVASLPQGP